MAEKKRRKRYGTWSCGHSQRGHQKLVDRLTAHMTDHFEHEDHLATAMEAAHIEEVLYLLYELAEHVEHHDMLRDSIGEKAMDWLRKHGLFGTQGNGP